MEIQNKFENVIEPFSKNGFMFVHPSDIAKQCTKLCLTEQIKSINGGLSWSQGADEDMIHEYMKDQLSIFQQQLKDLENE